MMAKWGTCDFAELKALSEKLEEVSKLDFDRFCRSLAADLAGRLLNKVKKRTPVGVRPTPEQLGGKGTKATVKVKGSSGKTRSMLSKEGAILQKYWSGYVGGTLRRNWDVKPLTKEGDTYVATLINNTEYASYVEFGHRQKRGRYVPALGKSLSASWVKGRFMMTISVKELEGQAPAIIEKMLYEFLKEHMDVE